MEYRLTMRPDFLHSAMVDAAQSPGQGELEARVLAATFRGLSVENAKALLAGELPFRIAYSPDSIDDVVMSFETKQERAA